LFVVQVKVRVWTTPDTISQAEYALEVRFEKSTLTTSIPVNVPEFGWLRILVVAATGGQVRAG
jgi:hypothetical protein